MHTQDKYRHVVICSFIWTLMDEFLSPKMRLPDASDYTWYLRSVGDVPDGRREVHVEPLPETWFIAPPAEELANDYVKCDWYRCEPFEP
jgi:hypothetical protein